MIARLLMSDIMDCIAASPRYFLLWTLSREAFKLIRRIIFFFILIFLIKQFLIEKEYLEKTVLENVYWVAPYFFCFALGTLVAAFLKKFSLKAQKRFNLSLRAPIFQKYHKVPRAKIINGLRCFVTFNLYLFMNFIVCWLIFDSIIGAVIIFGATALICIVLFVGTRQLTPHTTALLREPIWNLIEGIVLIIYYSFMMCIVIFMEIDANVSAMIFIILIPRQLITSLIGCAQSCAFYFPQQVVSSSN